jgi:rhodanese-related sulfurtransferase
MIKILKSLFGPRKQINFPELVAHGALIIDVRSPEEFKQGHLKNSTNIPLNMMAQKIPDIKKKGKAIITVCRSGARSGVAKNLLAKQGIEVYNGGGWTSLQNKLQ